MFKVNKNTKKLEPLEKITILSDLGLKERQDLQEWIESNPIVLGEELLIIQKEFAGFSDTKERLDLLALDKNGNVVVIENKLDDSGKDVVWQSIKYASYITSITTNEIVEVFQKYIDDNKTKNSVLSDSSATQILVDFFGVEQLSDISINKQNSQRIILVSKSFRSEVLSAVSWLLNYGINIACIKITPYLNGNEILLDTEQILPQKELKDYTMKLAIKAKDELIQREEKAYSEDLRNKFWKQFILYFSRSSKLFDGVSGDRYDHWLSTGSGISGVTYAFLICKNYCGVELTIAKSVQDENKKIFDNLKEHQIAIESSFGEALSWERLDNAKMSRIIIRNYDLSLYNFEQWEDINKHLTDYMIRIEKALKEHLGKIKKSIKAND